jgi:hypothetical protein
VTRLIIFAAVFTCVALYTIDHIEQQVYQAKAVKCAVDAEAVGCERFQTAAGPEQ